MPRDLMMLRYVDRFGLGVLGRQPGAGELKRMAMVEKVTRAYQERAQSDNWAAWAISNPDMAKLLEIGATHGE